VDDINHDASRHVLVDSVCCLFRCLAAASMHPQAVCIAATSDVSPKLSRPTTTAVHLEAFRFSMDSEVAASAQLLQCLLTIIEDAEGVLVLMIGAMYRCARACRYSAPSG